MSEFIPSSWAHCIPVEHTGERTKRARNSAVNILGISMWFSFALPNAGCVISTVYCTMRRLGGLLPRWSLNPGVRCCLWSLFQHPLTFKCVFRAACGKVLVWGLWGSGQRWEVEAVMNEMLIFFPPGGGSGRSTPAHLHQHIVFAFVFGRWDTLAGLSGSRDL